MNTTPNTPPQRSLFAFLKEKPPADGPYRRDDLASFRRWQYKIMGGMMLGYAHFYIIRKNFSMAMPSLEKEVGYSNTELGLILTCHLVVYGVGKFLNGMLADRANPRYFMMLGLGLSALINLVFPLSHFYWAMVALWALNGWAQSMGWPPCAKLLTSWYEPNRVTSWWGLWNASHQIGGAAILVGGGFLIESYGWQSVFWVPAYVALFGCLLIFYFVRDRPESMGFASPHERPPSSADAEGSSADEAVSFGQEIDTDETLSMWGQTRRYIITNPLIWLVSLGNAFVYIVRIGMLDWSPKFLKEARGVDLTEAGALTASLEIAGILGGLAAGAIVDRYFKGRAALVISIYMLVLAVALVALYKYPVQGVSANLIFMVVIGFLVYGPQMLTAVSAARFAPRSCAAAATGFNGLFGYLGAAISGVGTGYFVDNFGWGGGVIFYCIAASVGLLLFASAYMLSKRLYPS